MIGVALGLSVLYCRQISTLSRSPMHAPCPQFGLLFRVLYGLFGTRLAEAVLSKLLHTPEKAPQAEQLGGTKECIVGSADLRIMIVPILGSAFGGNYGFLLWDEADEQRRAIAVDPADPHPILRAAESQGLRIELLLTTHWHFDHSSGNRTLAKKLPGLKVVASAEEVGHTPAVTHRAKDLELLTLGRLAVRAHSVPGHTLGSMVYEVYNSEVPSVSSAAFTGDTLFCGGCGALFEVSATTYHASFQRLIARLKPSCRLFSGHEYAEMLMQMAIRREPNNEAARAKFDEVKLKRARKQPSVPSTLSEALAYNPHLRATPQQLAIMCGCGL